jgi:hypothetical protein
VASGVPFAKCSSNGQVAVASVLAGFPALHHIAPATMQPAMRLLRCKRACKANLDSARLTLVSVSAKHWLSLYIAPPAGLHGAPYCGQPGGAAVPGGPRCQERPGSRGRGSGVPGESGLEAAEGLVGGVSLQPRSCELPVFVLPARITPKACSPDTLPTDDPASSLDNRR